jgi:sn-glycerol 3-phosphate transport system permease protein
LFADPAFRKACANNLLLVALTTAPGLALALWLAVMLKRSATLSRILRSIFFFPTVVPLVAASSLWIFIFLPGMGLIDHYLTRYFGMGARNYLGDEHTALAALAVLSIWKFAGYYMVFFVAALQSIPDDALEAAILEGAGPWQSFRLVTLPLLRPTITFVGVIAVIYAVTQVDHIMMMTNGGPDNSTSVLLFYIFTTAQDGHDLGKASAATVLTLGALLLITVFNMNILERGTHYEQ